MRKTVDIKIEYEYTIRYRNKLCAYISTDTPQVGDKIDLFTLAGYELGQVMIERIDHEKKEIWCVNG